MAKGTNIYFPTFTLTPRIVQTHRISIISELISEQYMKIKLRLVILEGIVLTGGAF